MTIGDLKTIDKAPEFKRRFYWCDPPLGKLVEKNISGIISEFYDNLGWDGNFGKIRISDETSAFYNQEFTFFKEHVADGLKIPLGNHNHLFPIGERMNVVLDAVVSDAGMHPTLNTVHWATNIRADKIKDAPELCSLKKK